MMGPYVRSYAPRGAFRFHSRFASSSDARSYDVNEIFLTCSTRRRYSGMHGVRPRLRAQAATQCTLAPPELDLRRYSGEEHLDRWGCHGVCE